MSSEGRAIRCGGCGAHFPLATLSPGASCPYCGTALDLGTAPAREARQYEDDFFAEMRRADQDRQAAVSWGRWADGGTQSKAWLALLVVMLLGPVASTALGALAHQLPMPDTLRDAIGGLASTCGVGLMLVAVVGYVAWMARATRVRRAGPADAGPPSRVACPHCGAPNELAPGQALQTCAHCRGALVPSRTVIQRGLDAARAARRQASLTRYAAERRGMLGLHQWTRGYDKTMPVFLLLTVVPMFLGYGVLRVYATDHTPLEYACIGGPILLAIGLVAAGATWWLARWRRRRQAWRGAVSDLARQFGGWSSEDLEDFVGWLEATWAGPYDTRFIGGGPRWAAALASAWGYRVAVVLNPEVSGQYAMSPSYARVLLAAWVPSASDGGPPPTPSPEAQRTIDWLKSAGFLVSCEEAGILAMAQQGVVDELKKHPASAHQLAPIVGHLARLAHEIGAQPV